MYKTISISDINIGDRLLVIEHNSPKFTVIVDRYREEFSDYVLIDNIGWEYSSNSLQIIGKIKDNKCTLYRVEYHYVKEEYEE